MVPVGIIMLVAVIMKVQGERVSPGIVVEVFHKVLAQVFIPLMALIAAPAGIREDIEQRTIPLMLARPTTVWALPLGKGFLWFVWGSAWLSVLIGGSAESLPQLLLVVWLVFWAELAFFTLMGLVFKRGTLWGALYLFFSTILLPILPNTLQRLTFLHYAESLAGSRSTQVGVSQLLAQAQVATPGWLAAGILILAGLAFWGLAGWRLQSTPIGLAGADSEG
jgi:hypothetical protein